MKQFFKTLRDCLIIGAIAITIGYCIFMAYTDEPESIHHYIAGGK